MRDVVLPRAYDRALSFEVRFNLDIGVCEQGRQNHPHKSRVREY